MTSPQRLFRFLTFFWFLLAVTASSQAASEGEIRALFEKWNTAIQTADAEIVADLYAPDAVLLPTLSNRVRDTREGIVDYFVHFLAHRPVGRIEQGWVRSFGDWAIDSGIYVFTLDGEAGERKEVRARYTFVYAMVDGTWRIIEHHSSGMPEKAR